LEAGRFEITPQPTDLRKLLEEVAASFGGVAQLAKIRLIQEPNPLPTVQADPERIAQVVGNLLSNAFKFCPPGGTVWLRANEGSGFWLRSKTPAPASRRRNRASSPVAMAAHQGLSGAG